MVHPVKAFALVGAALGVARAGALVSGKSLDSVNSEPITSGTPAPATKQPKPKVKRQCPAPAPEVPPPSGGGQQQDPAPAPTPAAGKYNSKDVFIGDGFYNGFDFFTSDDPTHGRVDYVDMGTAQAMNLTSAGSDSFIMRADRGPTDPASRGRKAVRITSKNWYDTHVIVADIRHMPTGSPTWPALWEFGADWPNNGELDILEGANDVGPNQMTLHTTPGCTQPMGGRDMKGTPISDNCDVNVNGNQGCVVRSQQAESYGPAFNANGGGWYAAERTDGYVKVWFWGRNDGSVPDEVRNNVSGVNPDSWGQPSALFVTDACPIGDKFGPNQLVINLTFCGDWAGNTFPGGMGPCNDMVNVGGDWLSEAFWDLARISVYA